MFRNFKTKEEKEKYRLDFFRSIDYENDILLEERVKEARGELLGVKHPAALLLDSSLISATKNKKYDVKVIECGNTIQVYMYQNCHLKKDKNLEKVKNIDVNYLFKKENIKRKNDLKVIEYKNIMRSKFELQRLVKTNEEVFKTFITLTFSENVKDIESANKIFHIWRTKIQSILKSQNKEFLYVCVPEFQKRGAVHYHLITNLDIIENSDIILPQEGAKGRYDVKYWSYGFTSVFKLENMNVVGYITKYMTKDIDNRLWGKRRYLYSLKLKRPIKSYLDLCDDKELLLFLKSLNDTECVYNFSYLDYTEDVIDFYEYKKKTI